MKNFIAVTETGTEYHVKHGFVQVKPQYSEGYYFRARLLKVVDRNQLVNWDILNSLPDAELPTIGLSLYLNGLDEWRLSTPIKSVVELA